MVVEKRELGEMTGTSLGNIFTKMPFQEFRAFSGGTLAKEQGASSAGTVDNLLIRVLSHKQHV